MNGLAGVAIYFVIWWLCLFVVLPWGVRSQHETDEIAHGTEPGAPLRPLLVRKVIATTLLASTVFVGLYIYFNVYGLTLENLTP
jgi:predicted secreted protein